jgi:hypothetical protein
MYQYNKGSYYKLKLMHGGNKEYLTEEGYDKISGSSYKTRTAAIAHYLKDLKPGKYKILVKQLTHDHLTKNCHNYSLFSLYDFAKERCCNYNDQYIANMLQPPLAYYNAETKESHYSYDVDGSSGYGKDPEEYKVGDDSICKQRKCEYIYTEGDGDPKYNVLDDKMNKEYTVHLYGDGIDNYSLAHTSREEDGKIWHKFITNDFLFAVDHDDILVQHLCNEPINTVQIHTRPVPESFFVNPGHIDKITIDK